MYSRATPSGSITAFSLCCRYLAMDVAVAASWSLLSNQDCISNILASFTGRHLRSSCTSCTPPSIYFSTAPSLAGSGF